jgi:dihydrofolate reductase
VALRQLYIAQSIDGYIADEHGGVEWLERFQVEGEDYGYEQFFSRVGAIVLGATTYKQALGWGQWPYGATPAWVFTHQKLEVPAEAEVHFVQGGVPEVVAEIEQTTSENIWLVGGARLVNEFMDARQLDELLLFVVPVLLGRGVRLFQGTAGTNVSLVDTTRYETGLIEMRYRLERETFGPELA